MLGALLDSTGGGGAADTLAWDETFPKSDKLTHQKVSYLDRPGINRVGDLDVPKGIDRAKKTPALFVGAMSNLEYRERPESP